VSIGAQWRGQAGFFEIWFLVVFEPVRRRAWWLRYTTWAPVVGVPRATMWAAVFMGDAAPWVRKTFHPAIASSAAIGDNRFGAHGASGHVDELSWDLAFDAAPQQHGPSWLARLPAPTRVQHLADGVPVTGWIARDGVREELRDARVVAKHLWGTRRVEELYWVCCPGRFEATQVRLRRDRGPRLTTVWLDTGDGVSGWDAPWDLLRSRVVPDGPGVLRVQASSPTRRLSAVARCDPATLAGWAYRDPAGWDVHVAQSDVATCAIELTRRPHPLAPWGTPLRFEVAQAAVEFHHPDPLPGVRYLAWGETR
jgi:hypothetical protein